MPMNEERAEVRMARFIGACKFWRTCTEGADSQRDAAIDMRSTIALRARDLLIAWGAVMAQVQMGRPRTQTEIEAFEWIARL